MKNLIPRMATINEASEITGLARYFIRQLAITNKVKTVKAGKKYLINVDKLIKKQRIIFAIFMLIIWCFFLAVYLTMQ